MLTHRPSVGSWIAPEAGWLKYNVDAAVTRGVREAGIGDILRDHSGKTLLRFSKAIGISEPTRAELTAILLKLVRFFLLLCG
ncbi:hypothetical protein V6N12_038232 [Hibiscus sabdariffa]|uniref:Uncharacterized protein n=1 Tax=Hibiscus sabdariffa TaxID=183260 RepID=A0ABR2BX47_9ROSI